MIIDSDDRDLTDWFVRQVNANLLDPELALIRSLNELAAKSLLSNGACSTAADLWLAATYKRQAYDIWANVLVKDRARYDYKHAIKQKMGEAIRLCHYADCEWMDYSVPGNVNYGYIGLVAGFNEVELHGGASYAEICDPAHRAPGVECYMYPYFNPNWSLTFYDDPTDFWAIELGFYLYRYYPQGFSEEQFRIALYYYYPLLPRRVRPFYAYTDLQYGTSYPLGYFDGPGGGFTYSR